MESRVMKRGSAAQPRRRYVAAPRGAIGDYACSQQHRQHQYILVYISSLPTHARAITAVSHTRNLSDEVSSFMKRAMDSWLGTLG